MNKLSRTAAFVCASFLLSTTVNAATFFVDSVVDAVDITPGDGVCATEAGACTLRAAVMEANALGGADIIDLTSIDDPLNPITLTLEGVDEVIELTTGGAQPCQAAITADASVGDLDITEDLEIFGAGPALTIIQWENQSIEDPDVGDRIFHVQAEAGTTVNLVRLADLMVTRGSVGIPNTTDPENPYNCEVTGEPGSIEAWQFRRTGGAIAVGPGASVVLFEEAEHGPGTGGEGQPPVIGPPDDHDDETEGGVTAVEFERIAVISNQAGSDGGGILAAAEMTITDSVLSGNFTAANGGALYLDSPTTITGTLIGTSSTDVPFATGSLSADLVSTPNQGENGGGIFDTGFHTTDIESSAINGNTAIGGGGIAGRSLVVINLTNSTVSGNTGSDVGGGITTNGTVNLRNVTVADNRATTDAPGGGAGLNSFGSGTFIFYNTILSNNVVQGGETAREANCGCSGGAAFCPPGRMVSTGYNVNDEATDTCSLDVALNDQAQTDPLLEPLANNGGLTETHALPTASIGDAATSPAIDAADNQRCPSNDQRGSLRPDDGDLDGSFVCDAGAYERFIARTDLHINNVVAPNRIDKGDSFTVVVEIHNDDGNSVAPGVTLSAVLDTLTGMSIGDAVASSGTCTVVSTDELSCAIGDMAIGAIETVTLTLTGNEQGTFGLESTVDQTGDPDLVDTVPGNNVVAVQIFVLGNSDIALSGGPAATTVDQGSPINLDYTVVNNGEDAATSARLGLLIPTATSFVSATTTKGDCAESSGEVLCNIGDLALAETAGITVSLNADVAGDVNLLAIAGADQNDPVAENNEMPSTVTVIANADLAITATSVDRIRNKRTFAVSVTVTNNGPQAATNVVATADLPSLVSFVSSSSSCTLTGVTVTCTADQIDAGESVSFNVDVKAESVGDAVVSGSVVADENDPDLTNNEGSASIRIVRKSSSGGGCAYNPGGPIDPTLPLLLVLGLLAIWWRRPRKV